MALPREGARQGRGPGEVAGPEKMRDGDQDAQAHAPGLAVSGSSALRKRKAARSRSRSCVMKRKAFSPMPRSRFRSCRRLPTASANAAMSPGFRQHSGLAVLHHAGNAAIGAGNDRAAERLSLQQHHAVSFVDRGPDEEIGRLVQRPQIGLTVDGAVKLHPLRQGRRTVGRSPPVLRHHPPHPVATAGAGAFRGQRRECDRRRACRPPASSPP